MQSTTQNTLMLELIILIFLPHRFYPTKHLPKKKKISFATFFIDSIWFIPIVFTTFCIFFTRSVKTYSSFSVIAKSLLQRASIYPCFSYSNKCSSCLSVSARNTKNNSSEYGLAFFLNFHRYGLSAYKQ